MFPDTIQKELKRSRLLARALAFALVHFREHYDMLSNPLSICKSGWQSMTFLCFLTLDPKFTQWLDNFHPGRSQILGWFGVVLLVLDWNSPCSTSHLCNDLIYTLVDSMRFWDPSSVRWEWTRCARSIKWVWQKNLMGIRVSNLLELSTSQDHKPICQDLLLWPPDASDIFPHCPRFPAPKAENQWPNSVAKSNWF